MMSTFYFKVNGIPFTIEPENYGNFTSGLCSAAGINAANLFSYEISISNKGQEPVTFLPVAAITVTVPATQPQHARLVLSLEMHFPLETNSAENPCMINLSNSGKSSFYLKFLNFSLCFRFWNWAAPFAR